MEGESLDEGSEVSLLCDDDLMEVSAVCLECGDDALTFEDLRCANYVRVCIVERRGHGDGAQLGGVALWTRGSNGGLLEVPICGIACPGTHPEAAATTASELLSPAETAWEDLSARAFILQLAQPSLVQAISLRASKRLQSDPITWVVEGAQSLEGPWKVLSQTNHARGEKLPSRPFGWTAPLPCQLVVLHPSRAKPCCAAPTRKVDTTRLKDAQFTPSMWYVPEEAVVSEQWRDGDLQAAVSTGRLRPGAVISSVAHSVWAIGSLPWRGSGCPLHVGFLVVQGVSPHPLWCLLTGKGIESECGKVTRSLDGITRLAPLDPNSGSYGFAIHRGGGVEVYATPSALQAQAWLATLTSVIPSRAWVTCKSTITSMAHMPLQKITAIPGISLMVKKSA
eukprot:TRINITY_DN21237_c0_g1_i1.p1 TRINITY_DN21237_c0_g1~~TRINITY_DN21237_c0_g1_i1.p1  ORF type:complete len:395 (+),score=88.72 TRINITY_DN21237_c0_g1_i1:39-1223(+)